MLKFRFQNSSDTDANPSRRGVIKCACVAATAAVAAAVCASSASAGYGKCSKCACGGFKPDYRNNMVCETCGHGYGDHW